MRNREQDRWEQEQREQEQREQSRNEAAAQDWMASAGLQLLSWRDADGNEHQAR